MSTPAIAIETVLSHVAFETDRSVDELLARDQRFWPSWCRAAVVWLAVEVARHPLPPIAAALQRNRVSVHGAKRRADLLRLIDADFRALTDMLAAHLRSTSNL